MNGIQLMVEEHRSIKRMLLVIRKACYGILQGKEIEYGDFAGMIDYVRNYADNHHHGKEEKLLFDRMIHEIGGAAEKLVRYGMLVEHDLGRLYMKELEEALARVKAGDDEARLDVLANAMSYTHLLHRHIEREDSVAYPFAERQLSRETLDKLDAACEQYEREMEANGLQDKYRKLLEELEGKYVR